MSLWLRITQGQIISLYGFTMSIFKLNQTGLLFVPKKIQTLKFLLWLRRVHAWAGFWGALAFLLIGISGFFLNHRTTLKIETGEPEIVSSVNMPVSPTLITDNKTLGNWAKSALHLKSEPRAPKKEGGPPKAEPSKSFMGQMVNEPETFEQSFTHPNGSVKVKYVKGSNFVEVKQDAQNLIGTLKNMHKGVGLKPLWILFIDTIAGALITMSITGFLLWSRLHGSRLVAGGIFVVSIGFALSALWPMLL